MNDEELELYKKEAAKTLRALLALVVILITIAMLVAIGKE